MRGDKEPVWGSLLCQHDMRAQTTKTKWTPGTCDTEEITPVNTQLSLKKVFARNPETRE